MREFENGEPNQHTAHLDAAGSVIGISALSTICPCWLPALENRRAF
ncbi:hypothetical protein HGP17_02445 [Rhizobium sp. P38BS-XIX]|nr:hypothetical protein [Rhizobium sp. P38BS-XIX]NLR95695.1 hypothetical protein [Rhizobium sp. P38BS-XIX]